MYFQKPREIIFSKNFTATWRQSNTAEVETQVTENLPGGREEQKRGQSCGEKISGLFVRPLRDCEDLRAIIHRMTGTGYRSIWPQRRLMDFESANCRRCGALTDTQLLHSSLRDYNSAKSQD